MQSAANPNDSEDPDIAGSGEPLHPWPLVTPKRQRPPVSNTTLFVESALLGTIYSAVYMLSKGVFFPELYQQVIWPISGLTLAAFAGSPKDRWTSYAIAIAIADFASRMFHIQGNYSLAIPATTISLIEPLLGAYFLQLLVKDVFRLSTIRRLFKLIFVSAFGSTAISALLGSLVLQLNTTEPLFTRTFFQWWTSNCVGVLVVAPVVLSWMDAFQGRYNYFNSWKSFLEFAAWQVASVWHAILIFGPPQTGALRAFQFPVFLMPLFFGISLRFGLRGITTSVLLFLFPAIYGTAAGYGYVSSVFTTQADQVWAIQRFVAVLTCTINILAILLEQLRATNRMLREQATLLTSIINSTTNGILVKDLDDRYLLANKAAAGMVGTTPSLMIGRHSSEVLPPQTSSLILNHDREVIQSNQAKSLEITTGEGASEYTLKLQVSPLHNDDDEVTGVIVFAEDVTQERKAQKSLAHSERRFRNYAASSPVGMFELDRDSQMIFANQRLGDITGLNQDELMNGGIRKRLHPDDAERVLQSWQQFKLTNQDWIEFSYRYCHPDGREIHLIVPTTVQRNKDREVLGYIGSAIDVSAQKAAERELFASRERFRTLAEGAPIGIFELDAQGRCTFANAEWSNITGFSIEQSLAHNWLQTIHPEDREQVSEEVMRATQAQLPEYEHETRILRPNGSAAWVVARISIIRGDGKSVTGYIGTITDITLLMDARKHLQEANEILEQRVKERTAALQRANALLSLEMTERARAEDQVRMKEAVLSHVQRISTLGELAAELAHELNQPLHAISTYAGGLLRRARNSKLSPQDIITPVQQIAVEAERAAELIRRTRSFAIRRDTHFQSMDVADVIREAIGLLAFEARQRSIQVELNLQPAIPPIMADSVQIQQVLVNLIRNAFDSVSSPGAIAPHVVISAVVRHSVMVGPVSSGKGSLAVEHGSTLDEASHLEIQVRDYGTGLSPELQEKVFDPFVSSKIDGLGLGLTISRSIADAHHGRLTAENLPDGGAIFRLLIPYSEIPSHDES
ncbi:MAG: PAS domain S-box protein [Planctomycetaceae bacterium]